MKVLGYKFTLLPLKRDYINLPPIDCVYIIVVNNMGKNKIKYVGRTTNLRNRICAHNKLKKIKLTLLDNEFIQIGYLEHINAYVLERLIIHKKHPEFNIKTSPLLVASSYKKILEYGNPQKLEQFKLEATKANMAIIL